MISLRSFMIGDFTPMPLIYDDPVDKQRMKYTGKKHFYEVNLCKDYLNSSFDDFIKRNNITIIDEDLYNYYLNENFDEDRGRYYGLYQRHLYETITQSFSADDLMRKIYTLSPDVHITNINYVNRQEVTQFSFDVDKEDDMEGVFTNQVKNLLHQYNYYIKERKPNKNSNPQTYHIVIEPYKPKEITNKVYDELHGIIYHITKKDTYLKKIKNKELIPKWKRNEYRDGRIFFIGNEDENEVRRQLRQIKNTSKELQDSEVVVLKVDLKKYHNKLRFRLDSSSNGYDAYFTEEPIPHFCITPMDLETWKELKI